MLQKDKNCMQEYNKRIKTVVQDNCINTKHGDKQSKQSQVFMKYIV